MVAFTENVAEAVRADHGARVNLHPIPQTNSGIERYARMKVAVFSDSRVAANETERLDRRPSAYLHILFDNNVRTDGNIRGNLRIRRNNAVG